MMGEKEDFDTPATRKKRFVRRKPLIERFVMLKQSVRSS